MTQTWIPNGKSVAFTGPQIYSGS